MKKNLIAILTIISIANLNAIWDIVPYFTKEGADKTYIRMNSGWFEGRGKSSCGTVKLTLKNPNTAIFVKAAFLSKDKSGKIIFEQIGEPSTLIPAEGASFKFDDAGANPNKSYAIFCHAPAWGNITQALDCDMFINISGTSSSLSCASIKTDFEPLKMDKAYSAK